MDSVHKGGIGGTYGGHPLSCAAAKVAITQVLDPDFQDSAKALGARMRSRFDALAEQSSLIGEVRGLGPMLGIEIVDSDGKPDGASTAAIVSEAFDKGLILMASGIDGNVIRALVPLVATEADIEEGLEIFEQCLENANK